MPAVLFLVTVLLDRGLLLELHALTLASRSYVLLVPYIPRPFQLLLASYPVCEQPGYGAKLFAVQKVGFHTQWSESLEVCGRLVSEGTKSLCHLIMPSEHPAAIKWCLLTKLYLPLGAYSSERQKEVRDMILHSGGVSASFFFGCRFLSLEEPSWRYSSAFSVTSNSLCASGKPAVKSVRNSKWFGWQI